VWFRRQSDASDNVCTVVTRYRSLPLVLRESLVEEARVSCSVCTCVGYWLVIALPIALFKFLREPEISMRNVT
jgi:hypothetical protein